MSAWVCRMAALAAVAAVAGPLTEARADVIQTGYAFVTDYGKSELDRYQYTYNQTINQITGITPSGIGGNTNNAYFLGGGSAPIKEGLQGTANSLIVVGGSHGQATTNFTRFTLDGALIGQIPVDFSSYNNGNIGIGNVVVTPDGRHAYAPLEAAGVIVKIDLATGAIVASLAFAGVHDVAIAADGRIYAANYSNSAAELIVLDADLSPGSRQILANANPAGLPGAFRPAGLSVAADGSLYVNDNTRGGTDSILHYTLSETGGTLSATYDPTKSYVGSSSNNALEFLFGSDIGPDGQLYVAALGGGGNGGFGTRNPYVDGIYAFNPVTGTVNLAIEGYTESNGPVGPSGLSAPKYLQFDTNFIKANDAGVPVPEPGTLAVLATALFSLRLRQKQASPRV